MEVMRRGPRPAGRHVPLFWRLFVPNASVLLAACIILVVQPANGRIPAVVGGMTLMLVANLVLMRHAMAPLERLTELMRDIDPLRPGRRLPIIGPESEVAALTRAFNDMLDRLEAERRESARRVLVGQEAERRHVAGELHDAIGQTLTALVLQLDRLAGQPPADRRQDVALGADLARSALDDVRRLAQSLRPEVLDELGLAPALTNLCDRLTAATGLLIARRIPGELPRLPADADLVLFRVAQESLTNVVRHAGARRAEVTLERARDHLELRVADDGVGIRDEAGGGIGNGAGGIRGMRERALLVGGQLDVEASPAGGTEVRLRIPLERAP
jgi:two-component system sensor histidine kinase UhpB